MILGVVEFLLVVGNLFFIFVVVVMWDLLFLKLSFVLFVHVHGWHTSLFVEHSEERHVLLWWWLMNVLLMVVEYSGETRCCIDMDTKVKVVRSLLE